MKPTFISSTSWPSALFCLSHAVSAQINAFKVSCCLFIPFPKNGSVGRWVACVVDNLNLLYRGTIQMVRRCVGRLQRGLAMGNEIAFQGIA